MKTTRETKEHRWAGFWSAQARRPTTRFLYNMEVDLRTIGMREWKLRAMNGNDWGMFSSMVQQELWRQCDDYDEKFEKHKIILTGITPVFKLSIGEWI